MNTCYAVFTRSMTDGRPSAGVLAGRASTGLGGNSLEAWCCLLRPARPRPRHAKVGFAYAYFGHMIALYVNA